MSSSRGTAIIAASCVAVGFVAGALLVMHTGQPPPPRPVSAVDEHALRAIDRRLARMEAAEREAAERDRTDRLTGASAPASQPPAPAPPASDDAANDDPVRADALARAHGVVAQGIARGRWTEADRTLLRPLLGVLRQSDVDELMRTLADAANHDELKVDGRSLL